MDQQKNLGFFSDNPLGVLKYNRHFPLLITFAGLAILTILACFPHPPQGPFDARDYTRIEGMRLEQDRWEALIEPIAAPIQVLAGAPDFRVAGVVSLLWVLLGAGAWGAFAAGSKRTRNGFEIALAGIKAAFAASTGLMLTIAFVAAARIPGWRLVVDSPDMIVADFHSHTVKSHDGLVSLKTNLEWHASRGYSVVGLTEHDLLFDHETEMPHSFFEKLPAVISGIETHTWPVVTILGLTQNTNIQFIEPKTADPSTLTALFSKQIHEDGQGVVIVVTRKDLQPGDVAMLADSGVDGFEIANFGHPDIGPKLRRALLDVCRSRGLLLLASTDWHGWSGLTRTWTVIKAPGASALSRPERSKLVMRKLRERNTGDIIPVVAGYMGKPSLMRALFSPFAETLRYARELSAARVFSWWFWVTAILVLRTLLARTRFRPGRALLNIFVMILGLGLVFSGISLVLQGSGSTTFFSGEIGIIAVTFGVIALVTSLISWFLAWRNPHSLRD